MAGLVPPPSEPAPVCALFPWLSVAVTRIVPALIEPTTSEEVEDGVPPCTLVERDTLSLMEQLLEEGLRLTESGLLR
ncbi:MAG: hypothetical protein RDV48_23860 [Candidatus Eremiobacteraeota bacterium]|nr:hypothetical protein [Candidatus Eremiobacteraeota bacterium]